MLFPITGGEAQIDEADLELVSQYKWHKNDNGYAVWRGIKDGKKQTIRMHRLIMQPPNDMVVDHINHDPLDNRRENLRIVTQSVNMRNMTNQGKGYWYSKPIRRWVVDVNHKYRGTFITEAEAADYTQAVREGRADKKPKPERTHCKYGHELINPIMQNGYKVCRTCSYQRSAEYFKRKYTPKPRQLTKEMN